MTNAVKPKVSRNELVEAWSRILPTVLNPSDKCTVRPDERNENALIVHIVTEGRSDYTFDFRCIYADDRECQVEFLDVERGGIHVDEHTEIIQGLVRDYSRHMHECAQQLHAFTHA